MLQNQTDRVAALFKEKSGFTAPKSYIDFICAGGVEFYLHLINEETVNELNFGPDWYQCVFDIDHIRLYRDAEPDIYATLMGVWEHDLELGPGISGFRDAQRGYYTYRNYLPALDPDVIPSSGNGGFELEVCYLSGCLMIGRQCQPQAMLLNPLEVTRDGEMEAFSFYSHACERFMSFAELLIVEIFNISQDGRNIWDGFSLEIKDIIDLHADKLLDIDSLMHRKNAT